MAKIFINYRRKDSAPYAGRLYDRLAGHFGYDHVFMDIDQIEPGEVFDQVIEDKLAAVQAAVVLIGEHWLDITDANGQRRLDDPDDWVRLEIAAVLERGIRVIPVLVGGATMPKSTQLPECLGPLTRRQAIEITDHRFHADAEKLIKALDKIPGIQHPQKHSHASQHSRAIRLPFEPEMVRIPPGKFLMGSNDGDLGERPVHEVNIDHAFEIGKYEVTFDEYDIFAKATGHKLPDDHDWIRGKRPVINVTFLDAKAYAEWLSVETGKKYRLPSEAEWEYVARAGTQTRYWWGDDIGVSNANCVGCGSRWDERKTAPVGSFKANTFGLYDTAGNVWELVRDCWHDNYDNAPDDGSAWLEKNGGDCNRCVIRGGSWSNAPQNLRSAHRFWSYLDVSNIFQGFRIARDF
ncbi:SUMF1/EgtB/PvdO family nonheme iron enzyme [Nitrosomonas sp. sh817]|uniref:SUMF1/EgtB/PvdO family nonheme iron enzyme n=1 Tax=Nitrosomonas sp. sh817 TaxID=3070658 RepID=UPI0027DB8B1A|nr:SUMF1/EgtB/PvdO family nonheme iron enzyme [Nitrosomonas sp. sh817]WMJ09027.1 SUMF1/EgtB/PvdO family nonheme iron enzyme [Nitrosomonas sp. sh817]